jgi:hypothetical protein
MVASACLIASSKTSLAPALAFRKNVLIFDRQYSIFQWRLKSLRLAADG